MERFEIEPLIDIDAQQLAIQNATASMSLLIPSAIMDNIILFHLSETQLYIETKSKTISHSIPQSFPMKICREIATFSGGFAWDGEFWCFTKHNYWDKPQNYPLHKYAYMNRVVYYCGNQDVIYCKAEEFCYGSRYFVEILVDHKSDEIWCGIVFNDLERWSSYQREPEQIAYYGGRLRKTKSVKADFREEFAELAAALKSENANEKSLKYEMAVIDKKKGTSLANYYWDMAFGIIHGRGKLMSDVLPWYGSGEKIGILVDTEQGFVYFFKEDVLVWYIFDQEIMNKENRCKVFGCTDATCDTLIYQRVLWNENREEDLQAQIGRLKQKVEACKIV